MKAYVMTTGILFGVLALVHLMRIAQEGRHLATDPWFILVTLAAAALGIWAWLLLRRAGRAS